MSLSMEVHSCSFKHKHQDGPFPLTQHPPKKRWTSEEDKKLRALVREFGEGGWTSVSLHFNGQKSNTNCRQRWRMIKSLEVVKGAWSEEEDQKMKELIQKYGTKHWSLIAGHMCTRNEKQCRERWHNHLNQSVIKSKWTPEEDSILLQGQRQHGNRWATISRLLSGRTDNCVKNRWYSALKKHVEMKSSSPNISSCRPTPDTAGSSDKKQKTISGELEEGSLKLASVVLPHGLNREDKNTSISSLGRNQTVGCHKWTCPMSENRHIDGATEMLISRAKWGKEMWAMMCGRTEDQLIMTQQAWNFMESSLLLHQQTCFP